MLDLYIRELYNKRIICLETKLDSKKITYYPSKLGTSFNVQADPNTKFFAWFVATKKFYPILEVSFYGEDWFNAEHEIVRKADNSKVWYLAHWQYYESYRFKVDPSKRLGFKLGFKR